MSVILGGAGQFVLPVFEQLVAAEVPLSAVITRPDSRQGRGRKITAQEIATLAETKGLPVFKPANINDPSFLEEEVIQKADCFLTASYGQFVGRRFREHFPRGSFNLHPSLLPKYRGASPVPATLLNGDKETGVTLFVMVREMDAGPIVARSETPVGDNETAGELLKRLAVDAGRLASLALPSILAGELDPEDQDPSAVTMAGKLIKADGIIDWKQPAEVVHNLCRAMDPWPGAQTFIDTQRLTLSGSRWVGRSTLWDPGTFRGLENGLLLVSCGDGVVGFSRVKKEGKNEMSAADFINGQRMEIGDPFK